MNHNNSNTNIVTIICRNIFRTLIYLMPEAYSKSFQISEMMSHIENVGMARMAIFRDFKAYSATFSTIQPFSGILRDIKVYSCIFRHYWGILSHILTWSELCINLVSTTVPYLKPLAHLEPEASSNTCWTCKMIRYIQSPGIQMHIQPHSQVCNYWRKGEGRETIFSIFKKG